jgi:hypothetical protein
MALNQNAGSGSTGHGSLLGAPPSWFGVRNAKGEWQPPYPVKYAPLFEWLPRPVAVLKWLFSYPGFLWPWNSVYLLMTVGSWLYLQPALSRCVEFKADWSGTGFTA